MKIIRKLDEDDLKKIVAAHFYIDENDVSIYTLLNEDVMVCKNTTYLASFAK